VLALVVYRDDIGGNEKNWWQKEKDLPTNSFDHLLKQRPKGHQKIDHTWRRSGREERETGGEI